MVTDQESAIEIVIPTRGRVDNQQTIKNLPLGLQQMVTVVCPDNEARQIQNKFPSISVCPQPEHITTIAMKRKWIMDTLAVSRGWDKLVMLDDDLRFAVRREDDPSLFRPATSNDVYQGFRELEEQLTPEVPHAGFSARGGGISEAAQRGGWQQGKRMMYVLGYHVPTVLANAEFGRILTHEDMDICLQLLSKGFPNAVSYTYVVDQKFGNPGGCTGERSIEENGEDCYLLEMLHPKYVTASEREYKGGNSRIEVTCYWQRALKDGLALRNRK